jgi:hypothetical protein
MAGARNVMMNVVEKMGRVNILVCIKMVNEHIT